MQPYFFPYIGYFQLINAVDVFVFYDDVNFIKKGYINRNKILVNGTEFLFSIPLTKISQNRLIIDSTINSEEYRVWKDKFIQTIEFNYKKAPFFDSIFELICDVIKINDCSISSIAIRSVEKVADYLDLKTTFCLSSNIDKNVNLEREEKLIEICKKMGAKHYINTIGGAELYSKQNFSQHGIYLNFIKSNSIKYSQFNDNFIPNLSIIDVLMFNSKEEIFLLLKNYELL